MQEIQSMQARVPILLLCKALFFPRASYYRLAAPKSLEPRPQQISV